MFTPESLKQAEDAGELDIDSNVLGLKPDPVQLVRFVQGMGRGDVSSEMFVKLLEGYRELRSQPNSDPLRYALLELNIDYPHLERHSRTLLYLQLVLQMQKLSAHDASGVLKTPEHILTFIKHALESPRSTHIPTKQATPSAQLSMDNLRIVPLEEDEVEDGDSDDEEEGGNSEQSVEDITSTALKLLLAVLEGR